MNPLRKAYLYIGMAVLFISTVICAQKMNPHPGLFAPHPMPATQPQITFQVGVLSPGQNWAIALEPNSAVTGYTFAPGFVIPMDTTQPGVMPPDHIGTLGEGYYTAKDSDFAFQNTQNLNQSVFVVAQVPPDKPVSIVQNGAVVFHATVTTPVLLVDGNQVAHGGCARCSAVAFLTLPPVIQQEIGPALRPGSDGGMIASTAALRRHLTFMPAVGAKFSSQTYPVGDGRATFVVARIQIDAIGKVTSVTPIQVHGSGPFLAAVTQALMGARFKPFSYQGNATSVSGTVQFSLSSDGGAPDSNIGW